MFVAYVKPLVGQYTAPPFLRERRALALRWRVIALDAQGAPVGLSDWRSPAAR